MIIKENYDLGKIVTFVPNKHLPIYNWFYYKEGFSRAFVEYAYKVLEVKKDDLVLDPFLGCGTTALYGKEKGNVVYGLDVNDVALLAAWVKTRDYDIDKLKDYMRYVLDISVDDVKDIDVHIKFPLLKRAYPFIVLKQIFAYKERINSIRDKKYRHFFMLGLMKSATIATYAEKDGGVVKINKKRKFPPLKKVFRSILKQMIGDIEKILFEGSEDDIIVVKGDARYLSHYIPDEINVVITSPPYLNKIEYTTVYSLEYALFFESSSSLKKPFVKSYIGEVVEDVEDVFDGKYPMNNISKSYFRDLYLVVKEIKKVAAHDVRGCFVIGNGCFPNGVVESDVLLAELLEREGFKVKSIERVNKRWCMRNRIVKVAPMHESIVWFENK